MQDFFSLQQTIVFTLIFAWLLIMSIFFWKIYSHYCRLIGKTKHGDLVSILERQISAVKGNNFALLDIKKRLESQEIKSPYSIKKVGLVRFNPFRQLGGNQSFSLALLDEESNGIVLSALHSKDSTRVYAKPVVSGKEAKYSLSEEEKEAVKIAKILKSKK